MTDKSDMTACALRHLTAQDFLAFGVQQIAYIRPAMVNGSMVFAIHAADGTPLAFHESADTARALTRQNDLEPVALQ